MGVCRNSGIKPDGVLTVEEARDNILDVVKDLASMEKNNDAVVSIMHSDTRGIGGDRRVVRRKTFCYFSPNMRDPMENLDIQCFHYEDKEEGGQCLYQKDFPLSDRDLVNETNNGVFSLCVEGKDGKPMESMVINYDCGKENGKGKLEYVGFVKHFSGKDPFEQFNDHLRLGLLMGNCTVCCYDEGYDRPVDKVNWDIHIGNPVPPRFLDREMDEIRKRLEKENKFDYSYGLKERDIVGMTEFKYTTFIDAIDRGGGSPTAIEAFASMFASEEERDRRDEIARENDKITKETVGTLANLLSPVIKDLGLERKGLCQAFNDKRVFFYRNGREYLVIRGKEGRNDDDATLCVSGVLSPGHEKGLRKALETLDNGLVGIKPFNMDDKTVRFAVSNQRVSVVDLDGRQMPAYFALKHDAMKADVYNAIRTELNADGVYGNDFLPSPKRYDVDLYGCLSYHNKHLDVACRHEEMDKVMEELSAENKVEYSYIGKDGRKGMLRDIAGKPHLAVVQDGKTNSIVLKDGNNVPVAEFHSTDDDRFFGIGYDCLPKMEKAFFAKYGKEISAALDKGAEALKDTALMDALREGLSEATRESRREWAINDYMTYGHDAKHIDKEFYDVITDREVFDEVARRRAAEKGKETDVPVNTETKTVSDKAWMRPPSSNRHLTEKQKRLVFVIEKWAKENDIRNGKGYVLSLNRKSDNPQAALNLLVKQAKGYGWGKDRDGNGQDK